MTLIASEEFPTEELQRKEQDRLHKIIERLVVWENTKDRSYSPKHTPRFSSQQMAIRLRSWTFAGGGTIPLEAQRLGLEAPPATSIRSPC